MRRRSTTRACQRCRCHKTRCELPDLTVKGGAQPLPVGTACHRCSVLGQTCVLDQLAGTSSNTASGSRSVRPTDPHTHDIAAGTRPHNAVGTKEAEDQDLALLDKWKLSRHYSSQVRIPVPFPAQEDEGVRMTIASSSPAYDLPAELTFALLSNAFGPGFGDGFQTGGDLREVMAKIATALADVMGSSDFASRRVPRDRESILLTWKLSDMRACSCSIHTSHQ